MEGRNLGIFLAALVSYATQGLAESNTYVGAVVEYNPITASEEAVAVALNVLEYEKFMGQARAKGADIIVFPENGLGLKNIISAIPDPVDKIAPYLNFTTTQFVKDLSKASKTNGIYSVVNLVESRKCEEGDEHCPPSGKYTFNTNVVFDRDGVVVARYAKFNLYDEAGIDKTPGAEISFFDTDFGVRFGTFTCFDILFAEPAQQMVKQFKITDFVFTTHWFSELPFLTAVQTQRGWAETNNVNLLASGMNKPSTGSGGSGIYNGKYGALCEILPETTARKLLVATIPKMSSNLDRRDKREAAVIVDALRTPQSVSNSVADAEGFHLVADQIFRFKSEVIPTGKDFDRSVCSHNNFCCSFKVNVKELKKEARNYKYRAVVYNGPRMYGATYRGGVQVCGVIACNGTRLEDCTSRQKEIEGAFKFNELVIRGSNFRPRNSFQMPSTLSAGKNLLPLPANKYSFEIGPEEKSSEVSLELVWPVTNLHTFAIYGRDFTQDGGEFPTGEASLAMPLTGWLVTLVAFLLFVQ